MKKYILLIFIFVICMSGFAFATPDLPDREGNYIIFTDGAGNERLAYFTSIYYKENYGVCLTSSTILYSVVDNEWVYSSSTSNMIMAAATKDKIVECTTDILTYGTGVVFFSPVLTIKGIPKLIIPQIVLVAGIGILMLSSMLCLPLLKQLWNFL